MHTYIHTYRQTDIQKYVSIQIYKNRKLGETSKQLSRDQGTDNPAICIFRCKAVVVAEIDSSARTMHVENRSLDACTIALCTVEVEVSFFPCLQSAEAP